MKLVASGGVEAATTRAIADTAAVQAPTIYRLFGDKAGLLDAVAEQTLHEFVARKAQRKPTADPVADLRAAWADYVAFNVANPAVFLLMTGRPGSPSKSSAAGLDVLRERVRRVAAAGRLRTSEERAVDLVHAMGTGVVLTLLQKPPIEREGLSEAACEAVLAAITTGTVPATGGGAPAAASALRANLDDRAGLSSAERQLLDEWLKRIASSG